MSALCLQPLAHQQTTALPQAMTMVSSKSTTASVLIGKGKEIFLNVVDVDSNLGGFIFCIVASNLDCKSMAFFGFKV
jgi:hypothetical protein